MEVSLPQTMLQKLLDLLKLESLKFCLKIHVHVIRHSKHRFSQPTLKRCVDWSILRDLLGAAICGEVPELSETDAERSTRVPPLCSREYQNACIKCIWSFTIILTNFDGLGLGNLLA